MRIKQLSCAMTLLTIAPIGLAKTVHLNDVLDSARQYYPKIAAAYANIDVAKAQLMQANGAFDPKLLSEFDSEPSGGYQHNYNNTELTIPLVAGGAKLFAGYRIGRGNWPIYDQNFLTNSGGEIRYGLEVPLLNGFMIDPERTKRQNKKFGIFQNQQVANLIKVDTLAKAANAYWTWVASARTMEYTKQLLHLATIRQKALERRHTLGDIAHIDSVENRRFIYQREAELTAAKRNFSQASLMLSLFYRNNEGTPVSLQKSNAPNHMPNVPNQTFNSKYWQNNRQNIIASNPIVQTYNQKINIELAKLKLSKNQLLPHLDFTYYSQKQYGTGGYPLLLQTAHVAGLRFSMPLTRIEAKGKLQEAESQLHRLRLERTLVLQQLIIEFNNALNEIENDRKRVHFLNAEVDAAAQVERAEIKRFEQGDSSLFLVNQREKTTFSARLRALQANVAYRKALVELRRLCAVNH